MATSKKETMTIIVFDEEEAHELANVLDRAIRGDDLELSIRESEVATLILNKLTSPVNKNV